jgi:transposase
MPKVYSLDLRERVLRSLDEGLSKSAAHRVFHVSRSTIDEWLCLREQTGSVSPRAMRCGGTSSLRRHQFVAE